MKFPLIALFLAVAMASLPVIADRLNYQSSARITNVERTDAQEMAAMKKVALVTLDQATAIAQKAAPGAVVKSAELDSEDGNVIYEIELLDSGLERNVIVDAGNGKILANTVDRD